MAADAVVVLLDLYRIVEMKEELGQHALRTFSEGLQWNL